MHMQYKENIRQWLFHWQTRNRARVTQTLQQPFEFQHEAIKYGSILWASTLHPSFLAWICLGTLFWKMKPTANDSIP